MSGDLSGFSLIELFRMEAESHTSTLSAGLVSLEEASATPEVIEPLMRAAHSLKGAARIVGLDAIVRIAHAMEDCFVDAQKGKLTLRSEHVDLLLRGVDMLARVGQLGEAEIEAWQTERADEIDALVAELHAAREGRLPLRSGPPPPSAQPLEPTVTPFPSPAINESQAETGAASAGESNAVIIAPIVVPPAPSIVLSEQTQDTAPVVPGGPALPADRSRDRVVRVTAESLTRLLGLAGEALVQSHRFPPLVDSLWRLKGKETGLLESLQVFEDHILNNQENRLGAADRERLAVVKAQASQCLQTLGETVEAIEEFGRRSEDLSSRLHHEVLPAGCDRWPMGSVASHGSFATWPESSASKLDSRWWVRPRVSIATYSTALNHPLIILFATRWTTASSYRRSAGRPGRRRWAPSGSKLAIVRVCFRSF